MNIINLFREYFTEGHERTIEAKKNIAASFAIKGISISINLLLVPLTIHYVNPTQYGIWLTLSSIIGWFNLFDIGFGNGLRNLFTEAKATGNIEKARIYVSTTYAALSIIFISIWLLFIFLNYWINWDKILNAPFQMRSDLSSLACIVFSFFCIQIILKTINTVLIADQKPAKAAFFDMIGLLISLIIIYILTKTIQASLLYLGLAFGFAPVITLIGSSFWFFKRDYLSIAPSIKYIKFVYIKDIAKLGVKFFIIQMSCIIIYQTSNIIISQICGSKDVTMYNIAYKYFSVSYMFFGIIITPFWSAFADANSKKDFFWMKRMLKKLQIIALIVSGIVLIMLFLSKYAYSIWIGTLIGIRFNISLAMTIYFIATIYHGLFIQLINGFGKIKLQVYAILFGAIINVPLALFLGRKYGVEGVVMATIIFEFIILSFAPRQVFLLVNNKATGIWNK